MDDARFNKYFKSTEHFKIVNPNPRWSKMRGWVWDTADCVIRALANATGCSWLESFDYLTTKARRDYSVVNDARALRRWLVEDGAVWVYFKAEKRKRRATVLDFAKQHPEGRWVVSIANHETAVVNGVILDAWNCGDKAVVGVYDMTNFRLAGQ